MNGCASFNYRILFDLETPRGETKLYLQAFDRDLFTSNEFICEWEVDLKSILNLVRDSEKPIVINKKFYEED